MSTDARGATMAAAGMVMALLAPPRQPVRRLWWGSRLLGPVLALPLAVAAGVWLVDAGWGATWLVGAGLLVGTALGLARARGGLGGRLAGWLSIALVAGLPLVALLLVPGRAPHLVALAATGAALALAALSLPTQLADGLAATITAERRQWWQASLRAARLTRRTIGLGVYRQLCRTGSIRVLSAAHPGRVYLVPRRTSPSGARVLIEEHGRVIGGLCLRPRQPLPDPEEVVAHVLWLRGDERAYLAAANFFPYDTTLTPQATARRL